MIVATAGHVDHGKTELVKALTGVDTDRLPEEKRRGLSIDLGFAYQSLPGKEVLGFVDVPGHEKFVRNMLAGVGGIDMGLLVVAADDGVMPQTREHSAILDLLGVRQCMVVITKIDRVDTDRVDTVSAQVVDLLENTAMAQAPVFPVCAPRGTGIEALRQALYDRLPAPDSRDSDGLFRLAIDRCFSLHGVGLIVTGMTFSGQAKVGDRLLISPAGIEARVRRIRAQDQDAERAVAGDRCALNLVGKDINEANINRGDWVVDAALHAPTRRIDVGLRVLAAEPRALKHWTPVHLHLGAGHFPARVAVLEGGSIGPGEAGLAQLVIAQDIVTVAGDRVVLRDQSATRTIAGGAVIDPCSPQRGRARPARIQWVRAMASADPAQALAGILAAEPKGVSRVQFRQARNLSEAKLDALLDAADVVIIGSGDDARFLSPGAWRNLADTVVAAVEEWHRARPGELGPNPLQLRRLMRGPAAEPVFLRAVDELTETGRLARSAQLIHLPDHVIQLRPSDLQIWQRAVHALDPQTGSPLSLHQAAEELHLEIPALEAVLKRLCKAGLAVSIARNRYLPMTSLARLAGEVEALAAGKDDGRFSVAELRDVTHLGRNFVIELLEYFDRVGLTERLGNARRIKRSAADIYGRE